MDPWKCVYQWGRLDSRLWKYFGCIDGVLCLIWDYTSSIFRSGKSYRGHRLCICHSPHNGKPTLARDHLHKAHRSHSSSLQRFHYTFGINLNAAALLHTSNTWSWWLGVVRTCDGVWGLALTHTLHHDRVCKAKICPNKSGLDTVSCMRVYNAYSLMLV